MAVQTEIRSSPEQAAVEGEKPCLMHLVLSLVPGGTERLTIELVTRLLDDFRMVVCCLDEPGQWAHELTDLGVPVIPLQRAPGFHPSLGARVAQLAAGHDVDLIHCHHYSPFVYGRIACLLNRRPRLLFTEHGRLSDGPPVMKRRIANVWLSRCSGPVFAVSAALKQHMVAEGFPAGRVGVIHNGIDPGPPPTAAERGRARNALDIASDVFLVGTVARLDPVKDLKTAIGAIARLKELVGPIALIIVGDGSERAVLEAYARDVNVAADVCFVGYRADIRNLLPAFDVYVNSSISEGISLTILEAMATGLPVVATRVGGTPEVVIHDETGLLVEPRSAEAIAGAIERLAHAREKREVFGAAGRARVEALFTIDRMVADYAREYRRLVRR